MTTREEAIAICELFQRVVPALPIKMNEIKVDNSSVGLYGLRIDHHPSFHELIFVSNGVWMSSKNGEVASPLGLNQSQEGLLFYVISYNWACSEIGTIDAAKDAFLRKMNGLDESRVELAKKNVLFVQELLEEALWDEDLSKIEQSTCKGMIKMLKILVKKYL